MGGMNREIMQRKIQSEPISLAIKQCEWIRDHENVGDHAYATMWEQTGSSITQALMLTEPFL